MVMQEIVRKRERERERERERTWMIPEDLSRGLVDLGLDRIALR